MVSEELAAVFFPVYTRQVQQKVFDVMIGKVLR